MSDLERAPITLMWLIVYGTPLAKGSLRYVAGKRPINDNPRLVDWQHLIAAHAAAAKRDLGLPLLEGPLRVDATFAFKRPRGHYGTGRNAGTLKRSAPDHHTKRPDLDKLVRAVLDALNVVWRDDAQVVELVATKRYGEPERLELAIQTAHAAGPGPAYDDREASCSALGGRAQPARDNPHDVPLHIITDNE